tara:strand:- start:591 stop:752 length:162 start_codon:yes stop_codon:yes gene_type:complete
MLNISTNTLQTPIHRFTDGPGLLTDQVLGAKMVCGAFSGMEGKYCTTVSYRPS